jgi:hypothetical protein
MAHILLNLKELSFKDTVTEQVLDQLLGLVWIMVGALLVWLGPSLFGHELVSALWCRSMVSSGDPAGSMLLAITGHCPACYIGALMIAGGFLTAIRRAGSAKAGALAA